MKISRVSELTGVERTMEINVTPEQIEAWQDGELIQKVMPHLSDDEREFLISGITSEEWDSMFEEDWEEE